jgi:hypothetical protein
MILEMIVLSDFFCHNYEQYDINSADIVPNPDKPVVGGTYQVKQHTVPTLS